MDTPDYELPANQRTRIDQLADQFEQEFRAGNNPKIEDYLEAHPSLHPNLFGALLGLELDLRRGKGDEIAPEVYFQRFPDQRSRVEEILSSRFTRTAKRTNSSRPDKALPKYIDRYKVRRQAGAGGFGAVYEAWDDTIQRTVAIKIPHARCVSHPRDIEKFLDEARIIASLEHPHIVAVYDVGTLDDGRCFLVSKWIDGKTLADKLKRRRLPVDESAQLIATIAEALHHAHKKGVTHRDVKPANILIDSRDKPYLADFGLALRDHELGSGSGFAGTPAYMSPEQAEGKGNVLDGRSDIYSLGVVLYELLTGKRPHSGRSQRELLKNIVSVRARPPRMSDETIPAALERICLKALEKDTVKRYSTAFDMAAELRSWKDPASEPSRDSKPDIQPVTSPSRPHSFRPEFDLNLEAAMRLLLPYLADRDEHEHRVRQALDQAAARGHQNAVCCILHGNDDQCHDTFIERLRESTLRLHYGLARDKPVKRYHLHFPVDAADADEFDDRLRMQLAQKLRLQGGAPPDRIAESLAKSPWPVVIYSELTTHSGLSEYAIPHFLSYWDRFPLARMAQPVLVCLGIVYRRGSGVWNSWTIARKSKRLRRQLDSLELTAYRSVIGMVLPELRDLTLDDADNWLQTVIGDFGLREQLRPKIREIFARAPEISMDRWREALQNAIEMS